RSFRNSLMISIPATILPILIAAFAAYAFAWMKFRGRQVVFAIVVGLLVVPLQMTFVPVYSMFTRLGLTGTFVAIWLAHTGYGLPFAIYLLRNFFGSLPKDLFESAFLDGASYVTAFFRLALPLSVPALASLAIFQFLWVWNDLLVALIYLGGHPSVAPLTVRVAGLVNSLGADWHLLPAAAFISMILPLIVFFSMQRYFVRGILAGSVKG
ncbi:MAG: carbohydrate ABC transporter permease, partial [Anaerolineae bacterium]